jgi:acyl-coenzyme A thioesterase PaaI-like protein
MTPLEKIHALKMPFAELKGVTFTEAEKDRVVARMPVRRISARSAIRFMAARSWRLRIR